MDRIRNASMGSSRSEHVEEDRSAVVRRTWRRAAGIWIDDREAVIIRLNAAGAAARIVKNEPGIPHGEPTKYLDKVIKELGKVERIIAFGPARTKVDLWERLRRKKPAIVCECLTTRPMSRNQKLAWVKRYFAA